MLSSVLKSISKLPAVNQSFQINTWITAPTSPASGECCPLLSHRLKLILKIHMFATVIGASRQWRPPGFTGRRNRATTRATAVNFATFVARWILVVLIVTAASFSNNFTFNSWSSWGAGNCVTNYFSFVKLFVVACCYCLVSLFV